MRPEDFLAGVDACRDESRALHLERWGELGLPEVAPLWLLTCLPNMPACQVAILANLRGPNNTITLGESATNLAIAEACRWIEDGDADAVLVGGTGNNVTPFSLLHRAAEVDIAPGGVDPSAVCRPFDRDRSGVVMAEGAAAFVLESADSATGRGAPIYGEIVGFGSSCVISREGLPGRKGPRPRLWRPLWRRPVFPRRRSDICTPTAFHHVSWIVKRRSPFDRCSANQPTRFRSWWPKVISATRATGPPHWSWRPACWR